MNKRVALITCECVSFYKEIIDFKNKIVLSILSSGDQYLISLLFGAKQVDVFDINPNTWPLFVLKLTAIKELTYEEFYTYVIKKELYDTNTYNRLRNKIPYTEKDFLDNNFSNLPEMVFHLEDSVYEGGPKFNDGSRIPHYDKDTYYRLQSILRSIPLPRFYCGDIDYLHEKIEGHYDIMLASNIYDIWRDNEAEKTPKLYIELLKKYDIDTIQMYYYRYYSRFSLEFEKLGCKITQIPPQYGSYNHEYVAVYKYNR